jgi:hypothetical protein
MRAEKPPKGKKFGGEKMLEQTQPPADTTVPVDVEWKIRHLTSSIRRRERTLNWDGYATPHTPENPAVVAARTAAQLAGIAELCTRLAHWENIRQATTALSN